MGYCFFVDSLREENQTIKFPAKQLKCKETRSEKDNKSTSHISKMSRM